MKERKPFKFKKVSAKSDIKTHLMPGKRITKKLDQRTKKLTKEQR